MRVGEIRNIFKKIKSDQNAIVIQYEALFGGQAYSISNFTEIKKALEILPKHLWSDIDFSPIKQIFESHQDKNNPVTLNADEFNTINNYIGNINSKFPIFYLTLEFLTEEQDVKAINIKLPANIISLEELAEFNKRLDSVIKLFNIDGEFEFQGFDKGTDWYILVTQGILSYSFLLSCLKITQEYFKARTEYFKSEEARISFETAKLQSENGLSFEKYEKQWLELFIQSEVEKTIKQLETNGHTPDELHTKLVKATTKLIKELDQGTEFHLSLNPPSYANEKQGELRIDYSRIKESLPKNETPALKDGKEGEPSNNENS